MLRCGSLLSSSPGALAAIDDGVLRQHLVSCQAAARTDNTAVRQAGSSANITLGLQDIAVSYLETVADGADLEDVVVADDHDGHSSSLALHTIRSVDDLRLLLYEVALTFGLENIF